MPVLSHALRNVGPRLPLRIVFCKVKSPASRAVAQWQKLNIRV